MKSVRAILSPLQCSTLCHGLEERHPRFAILWTLGTETGLRVSDLLKIRVNDVKALLCVTEHKTGKKRKIDLSEGILETVRGYVRTFGLSKADFLFYSSANRTDKPMSRQWADVTIARTASKMGLISIGAHSMRKTYACNLYLATGSLDVVQRALNHKHKSTTLVYIRDVLESREQLCLPSGPPPMPEPIPEPKPKYFWLKVWEWLKSLWQKPLR